MASGSLAVYGSDAPAVRRTLQRARRVGPASASGFAVSGRRSDLGGPPRSGSHRARRAGAPHARPLSGCSSKHRGCARSGRGVCLPRSWVAMPHGKPSKRPEFKKLAARLPARELTGSLGRDRSAIKQMAGGFQHQVQKHSMGSFEMKSSASSSEKTDPPNRLTNRQRPVSRFQ